MSALPFKLHAIKPVAAVSCFITVVLTTGCSVFGIESVEEAPYDIVQKDGNFEVRDYAQLVVVQTRETASYKKAGNTAFRKLFRYISGDNEASTKIEMTSPVVSQADANTASSEKIAMTAPVISQKDGDTWLYQFVLPAEYNLRTAPRPTNPDLALAELPRKTVATVRYSGRATTDAREKNTTLLVNWIQTQSYTLASEPRWAGYNSPWALPSFRRNEVLIDVSSK